MKIQLIDTAIHISKQILLKLLFKFPNNLIVYFNFNNIDFKIVQLILILISLINMSKQKINKLCIGNTKKNHVKQIKISKTSIFLKHLEHLITKILHEL